jgi:hypothetical protein
VFWNRQNVDRKISLREFWVIFHNYRAIKIWYHKKMIGIVRLYCSLLARLWNFNLMEMVESILNNFRPFQIRPKEAPPGFFFKTNREKARQSCEKQVVCHP